MAILSDKTLDFVSNTLPQTIRLGIRLGELLQPGDVMALYGDLGSGKTALARGVGRGWGTALRVTSPTYTLINEYPRSKDGVVLYHLDYYRVESQGEIITTGIDDVFDNVGAFMIEWPSRIPDFLPEERLNITLRFVTDTKRGLRLEAVGERHTQLLKDFRKSAFGV